MDQLPDFTLGRIIGLLSFRDQVNCRLVCGRFDQEAAIHFSSIKNVRIEPLDDYYWCYAYFPIHKDPFPRVSPVTIDWFSPSRENLFVHLGQQQLSSFFTFLQAKCPNLQVLDFRGHDIPLEDLLKVSDKLIHMEIGHIKNIGNRTAAQLRPLFPRLRTFLLTDAHFESEVPNNWTDQERAAFCLHKWSRGSNEGTLIQWSRVGCLSQACGEQEDQEDQEEQDELIPPGISWYSTLNCHTLYDENPLEVSFLQQLNDPCIANSLKVLRVTLYAGDDFTMNLPQLVAAQLVLLRANVGMGPIDSLRNSPNLKILYLSFDPIPDTEALTSLISSFQHLESLCLRANPYYKSKFVLSLPPKLSRMCIFDSYDVKLVQTQRPAPLKYLFLHDIMYFPPSFSFPELTHIFVSARCTWPFEEQFFNSLKLSPNLISVDLELNRARPFPSSGYSWLLSLDKLEYLRVFTHLTISKQIRLSNYPRLRCLNISYHNPQFPPRRDWDKVNFFFEEKCQMAYFQASEMTTYIFKPSDRPPITVQVSNKDRTHFKYPLESTLTMARFELPYTSPSFTWPSLIKCEFVFHSGTDDGRTVDDETFEQIAASLSRSPKLQEVDLLTKPDCSVSLFQCSTLLSSLAKMEHLKQLSGRVVVKEAIDFASASAQYPSLARVQCTCEFVNA